MVKNPHDKYLISNADHICDELGNINQEEILKCENEEIRNFVGQMIKSVIFYQK